MIDKIIGIAKRDIAKGEDFKVPIDRMGNILFNDYIDFIEGTKIGDLNG